MVSLADTIWVFVVSKIVTDKTLIKKPSEVRELIWARAKILVKKMILLAFIEHGVISLFSYRFLTPSASSFLLDKNFYRLGDEAKIVQKF